VNPEPRYYAVIREPGRAWDQSRPMREQDGWGAHAEFMDRLAEEGFIRLGGPLGERAGRTLLVVEAAGAREIEERLAEDPWSDEFLVVASIEPWTVLLRAEAAP
jgi:hypothetical protein